MISLHTYFGLSGSGIAPDKKLLDGLLNARPGRNAGGYSSLSEAKTKGVNFTMFLTMMGEHLLELDSEAELLEAFESFDENDDGKVKCDEIRKWLSEVGDRMDQYEVRFLSKMNQRILRRFRLLRSTNF